MLKIHNPIEKKQYASRFDSVNVLDRAWGKRIEGESQRDATARLSNLLRDTPVEELKQGLSIRFTNLNKSPERYAYLKLQDQKENQSFGFFRDSYAIALVFNGEEIGYLPNPTSFQFLDTQGNPIEIVGINRIFPIQDSQATVNMFDLRYQLRLNELYDFTSASYINYTVGPGTFDVYKNLYGSSGTITVTEINKTRIVGTFDTVVLSNSFVKKNVHANYSESAISRRKNSHAE